MTHDELHDMVIDFSIDHDMPISAAEAIVLGMLEPTG